MTRSLFLISAIFLFISSFMASNVIAADFVYEDAEDGQINRWKVYDNQPSGAIVNNVYDSERASRVIELDGQGFDNGYMLGNTASEQGAWKNNLSKTIRWSMNMRSSYYIYISAQTDYGSRYFVYYDTKLGNDFKSIQGGSTYINYGLGYNSKNVGWQTITRDLEADLKRFETNNNIRYVNAFLVRGTGFIDDVTLIDGKASLGGGSEIGDWDIYDKSPSGAVIRYAYDADLDKEVIELSGSALSNGYRTQDWKDKAFRTNSLQWQMKFDESFLVYVGAQTVNGHRYFLYNNFKNTEGYIQEQGGETYLRYGLGAEASNGSWQSISRNLTTDLQKLEPLNAIVSIDTFLVRGSGRLSDIKTISDVPSVTETTYSDAEDGTLNGWRVYTGDSDGSIVNLYDAEKESRVLEFDGNGKSNGFILGNFRGKEGAFNNREANKIQLSMSYHEAPYFYFRVLTPAGERYISYDWGPEPFYRAVVDISNVKGSWKTYTLDLRQEGHSILAIDAILMRGSARIDDVKLIE